MQAVEKKSQFVEQKLSGRPENGHQPTGSLLDAVDKNFRSLWLIISEKTVMINNFWENC